ncbi:MAG: hypothetical protein K6G66_02150, partial [Oscillospiraceae bacterium]|nr:hypothetical protein [Oscillospiraceae bacterium]
VFYGKGNARTRAACFVPKGTKHVSYGLRRAFGAIKRFHSVLWETSMKSSKYTKYSFAFQASSDKNPLAGLHTSI